MQNAVGEHTSIETPVPGLPEPDRSKPRPSKKDRILDLYQTGITNVAELACAVHSQPSYVAQVLAEAGLLSDYFDLYTTSERLMNFYSRFSRGIVRFKTPEDARASVERIDRLYRDFESQRDHAGQHHAEVMALIGVNRALSCGKLEEARLFADWLIERLMDIMPNDRRPATSDRP
jgi:hypothetical protein